LGGADAADCLTVDVLLLLLTSRLPLLLFLGLIGDEPTIRLRDVMTGFSAACATSSSSDGGDGDGDDMMVSYYLLC
jgi:hypothetical protein